MIDIDFGYDQGPTVSRREHAPRIRGKAVCVPRRCLNSLWRSGMGKRWQEQDEHLVTLVAGRRLADRHARRISLYSTWSAASCGDYDAKAELRWQQSRRDWMY